MLLWPLFGILALLMQKWDRQIIPLAAVQTAFRKQVARRLISKWALSYALFTLYFYMFAKLSGTKQGDFDPSGHLTCGLLASALWLSIPLFISANLRLNPQ